MYTVRSNSRSCGRGLRRQGVASAGRRTHHSGDRRPRWRCALGLGRRALATRPWPAGSRTGEGGESAKTSIRACASAGSLKRGSITSGANMPHAASSFCERLFSRCLLHRDRPSPPASHRDRLRHPHSVRAGLSSPTCRRPLRSASTARAAAAPGSSCDLPSTRSWGYLRE